MTSENLLKKLTNSEALRSLRSEQKLVSALRKRKWDTTHGQYYVDPIERTWREVDVVAYSCWWSRRKRQLARLRLVAERKTLSNYHVIFSPAPYKRVLGRAFWTGDDGQYLPQLLNTFEHAHLSEHFVKKALELYKSLSYPRHMHRMGSLMPDPPAPPVAATAFRETNTEKERELASSVVWKAGNSLEAAVRSMGAAAVRALLDDLLVSLLADSEAGDLTEEGLAELLSSTLSVIDLFHPVLVLDAQLWIAGDEGLHTVPWCRFIRHAAHEDVWWFDIVNSSACSDYLDMITLHYSQYYRKKRASRASRRGVA